MKFSITFFLLLLFVYNSSYSQISHAKKQYIEISKANPSYFAFSDGSPYIPIGINLINPSDENHEDPEAAFREIEGWMKNLSANGGNYIRVWLSESFWDIEDKQAGQYENEKLKRIDRFVALARKYNLKIKITLEHFRGVTLAETKQDWATKYVYHTSKGGPLDSIRQYLTSAAGQQLFLNKLDFYKKHFGSDTLFFGLELWNEMNAMRGPEDEIFFNWNEKMLAETKKRFPENLVMQSLGSFDNENVRPVYKRMMLLPGNEIAQVHRYLDLGAKMEICQAPMDLICSSAIEELKTYNSNKPLLLAETGAVEPNHAGPSKYYELDTAGILLHDILFAPFFSGAAGTGMSWHWESYVAKNNLWYHFQRFSEAIKGVNPIAENFVAAKSNINNLRVYLLKGNTTSLIGVRDTASNWMTELKDGIPPTLIHHAKIDLQQLGISPKQTEIEVYDPWTNKWTILKNAGLHLTLPDFKRSIVIRLRSK